MRATRRASRRFSIQARPPKYPANARATTPRTSSTNSSWLKPKGGFKTGSLLCFERRGQRGEPGFELGRRYGTREQFSKAVRHFDSLPYERLHDFAKLCRVRGGDDDPAAALARARAHAGMDFGRG